jgi:2-dehydro-3-deoxyphosphogluconate aldolase/(4S)-4-hydroxy-2-oxoglutarate aldolase
MSEAAVIPVIRVASAEHAMCAMEGILAGGLPIVEITLTIPGAIEVIRGAHAQFGRGLMIGAGTVLDERSCEASMDAGAEFIVSPVFDAGVVAAARNAGKAVLPGALTPTEILHAWRSGADAVKVFPCGAVGGPSYIRALKGPLPDIPIVVTGGVKLDNVAEFLKAGALAVGAGETILPAAAVQAGDRSAIATNTRSYVDAVQRYRSAMLASR